MSEGTEQQWFYELKKQRHGPVSPDEMKDLIRKGVVSYGNVVWTNSYPDWIPVENSELREFLMSTSPPPLKGDNINNVFVWIIAVAPIWGEFVRAFILAGMYGDNVYQYNLALTSGELWYLFIVFNIVFCALDGYTLNKSGVNVNRFMWWILFLVPVYLYKRARHLSQSLAYFWVWIACFVLSFFL